MTFDQFPFPRTSVRQYHAIMAISALKPTCIQLPWPDPPTLLPLGYNHTLGTRFGRRLSTLSGTLGRRGWVMVGIGKVGLERGCRGRACRVAVPTPLDYAGPLLSPYRMLLDLLCSSHR